MKINLTEKQIRVLRFFRDYREENGLSPTLEEAASALGVSKITVHEHVTQLNKKGAVHRDKAKARSVTVLYDPDQQRLTSGSGHGDEVTIPILGTIAAGRPIEAVEDKENITLSELVPNGDDHYILKVRGKSMVEDHIDDGDMVVVERRQTAHNGEIVVAIVDDEEATLKRFYREEGRIRLQPSNSSLSPIYPERVEIRGIVRGVIRRFK